jgi:hypothetical protein
MNWTEFKEKCEKAMSDLALDPADVTVRVEVGDSFYDQDVTENNIWISSYDDPSGTRLVIMGRD